MSSTIKKQATWILGGLFLLVLTSCNLPAKLQTNTPNATDVYITAVAIMTEKAGTTVAQPTQPVTTPVPQVVTATMNTPVEMIPSFVTTLPPNGQLPCDLAKPGFPLDVTIPDDTRLLPGETFTKIWRFINGGSCTWTREYSVVWFSGDDLGVEIEQYLSQKVPPGESVDINIDMVAPTTPGVYSTYWMLRNDQGALFGLGPGGNAPFWAKIQVVAASTATETLALPPTETPRVEISGSASLEADQGIDLDSGLVDQGNADDLLLELVTTDQYQLLPVNTSRFGVYGLTRPGLSDCQGAVLSIDAVHLSEQQPGVFVCYRTNQGLPGVFLLLTMPAQGVPIEFEYLTWAVP